MSDIKVAVLDKFHPHIKVAITAAMPSNWSVRFIEENSLAARAAVLRDADIAFVMAAPVPKVARQGAAAAFHSKARRRCRPHRPRCLSEAGYRPGAAACWQQRSGR